MNFRAIPGLEISPSIQDEIRRLMSLISQEINARERMISSLRRQIQNGREIKGAKNRRLEPKRLHKDCRHCLYRIQALRSIEEKGTADSQPASPL